MMVALLSVVKTETALDEVELVRDGGAGEGEAGIGEGDAEK